MKCWRCGCSITANNRTCPQCNTATYRIEPTSDRGRALRRLYDEIGPNDLLSDSSYLLLNAYSDLCSNDIEFRIPLRSALDVGVGRIYLHQIINNGMSDSVFYNRVIDLLSRKAGLSNKAINDLINAFDEMIGWPTSKENSYKEKPDSREYATVKHQIHQDETKKRTNEKIELPQKPVILERIVIALFLVGLYLFLVTSKDFLNGVSDNNIACIGTPVAFVLDFFLFDFIIRKIMTVYQKKKIESKCTRNELPFT